MQIIRLPGMLFSAVFKILTAGFKANGKLNGEVGKLSGQLIK
jgi:hypothetical protein|nr:hypothetical protein [Bacillus infantis]